MVVLWLCSSNQSTSKSDHFAIAFVEKPFMLLMGSPKTQSSCVASMAHRSVFTKDLEVLHSALLNTERQRNEVQRAQAFVRLVDEFFKRKIGPSVILSHRDSDEGLKFRCAWVIDGEEPIEGWFSGIVLQEECPEILAVYLSRQHFPDHRATYRTWTRTTSPVKIFQFPNRTELN